MVSVQWKERESYEKTLKEEKTRPRSITSGGGGGGVGQAEAHGDSAMDLQSPREFFFFFFWNSNLGKLNCWSVKRRDRRETEARGLPAQRYDMSIFWALDLIHGWY